MKVIIIGLIVISLASIIFLSGCTVCNAPYILVGSECCLDRNDNYVCDEDEVTCSKGESLIKGECCVDENKNRICDVDEAPDYLFYDDFSNGFSEDVWQTLYDTPTISNNVGNDAPSLKIAGYVSNPGSAVNNVGGVSLSASVRVADFGDNPRNSFQMAVKDQTGRIAIGAYVTLTKTPENIKKNGIEILYSISPGSSPRQLLKEFITDDKEFHDFTFKIRPDGSAVWIRDGVERVPTYPGVKFSESNMFLEFSADVEAYVDNVIIE